MNTISSQRNISRFNDRTRSQLELTNDQDRRGSLDKNISNHISNSKLPGISGAGRSFEKRSKSNMKQSSIPTLERKTAFASNPPDT